MDRLKRRTLRKIRALFMKKYCDKVIDDWEAIIITRKNDKNVVLMSVIVW